MRRPFSKPFGARSSYSLSDSFPLSDGPVSPSSLSGTLLFLSSTASSEPPGRHRDKAENKCCTQLSVTLSFQFSVSLESEVFVGQGPGRWVSSAIVQPVKWCSLGVGKTSRADLWASLVDKMVKKLPAMKETQVWSLGQEDTLEKGMATHSSILAWRVPWREEPGGLQNMGLQRTRYDWVTNTWL